jgi:hypothetical protein
MRFIDEKHANHVWNRGMKSLTFGFLVPQTQKHGVITVVVINVRNWHLVAVTPKILRHNLSFGARTPPGAEKTQ